MRVIFDKLEWYHVLIALAVLVILYIVGTWTDLLSTKCTLPTDEDVGKSTEGFSGNKPTCVLYYATWCGYSRDFLPQWEKFEEYAKKNLNVVPKSVLCEGDEESKCNHEGVRGYPTVIIYLPDGKKVQYEGNRTAEDLIQWCQKVAK